MSAAIQLTKGMVAIVDDDDLPILERMKWRAKQERRTLYAVSDQQHSLILMHRYILSAPKGVFVDHIDCDGLNNRRSNLRLCTRAENNHNARTRLHNKSAPFKGVCFISSRGNFLASIRVCRRLINLGRFSSAEEAALVYDAAASRYFGEFARLNFPTNPTVASRKSADGRVLSVSTLNTSLIPSCSFDANHHAGIGELCVAQHGQGVGCG